MRYLVSTIAIVLMLVLALSCKNYYNIEESITIAAGDSTNQQLMDELDQFQARTFDLKDVTLPNGQNAEEFLQQNDPLYLRLLRSKGGRLGAEPGFPAEMGPIKTKNDFIDRLAVEAAVLTAPTLYKGDGTDKKPDHTGLAYVYNSEKIDARSTGAGNCKSIELQGVDCSGLLTAMLRTVLGADVVRQQADQIRQKAYWETLFDKVSVRNPVFKKMKVDVLDGAKRPPLTGPTGLQSGDVIFWHDVTYYEDDALTKPLKCKATACKREAYSKSRYKVSDHVGHIGMILKIGGVPHIIQSNGLQSPATCTENYWDGNAKSKRRGVQALDLSTAGNVAWFGPFYGVVRFNTKLGGKWEYNDRCSGRTEEDKIVKLQLTISEKERADGKQDVTGSGSGFDYNNTPITINITGTYDSSAPTLQLNCIVKTTFTNGTFRQDRLNITLSDDDTDWNTTINIGSSGGCTIEVRLKNLETNK